MYDLDFPGFNEALDRAAEGLARSVVDGLSPAIAEVLADPIVRAMMDADRVDGVCLEALLRQTASKLAPHRHGHEHPRHLCCAQG